MKGIFCINIQNMPFKKQKLVKVLFVSIIGMKIIYTNFNVENVIIDILDDMIFNHIKKSGVTYLIMDILDDIISKHIKKFSNIYLNILWNDESILG